MAETPPVRDTARLLKDLGHEVGNALAAIRLTSHLAGVSGAEGPPAAGAADRASIDGLCARAGALLAQIRPLVSPADGVDRSRLDADEILAGAVHAAEDSQGRLRVEALAPDTPGVRADADALHHLLALLVGAALAAAEPAVAVRLGAGLDRGDLVLSLEPAAAGDGLDLEIAAAVLARDGGRLAVKRSAGRVRIELRLPAAA